MKAFALVLFIGALGSAQTELDVARKKPLWFDEKGTLLIGDSRLCFTPQSDDEDARCWRYQDIQHLDRSSPTELELLSYEDVAWKLGRDRSYRFELLAGELSDALFDRLAALVGKPATDRVVEPLERAEQELPAKNLAMFGGSEGRLYFSPERIVYSAEAEKRSREWTLERDVESVWSTDPYRFEAHVYEGNPGAFRKPRVYKFALKRPLDPEFYRRLKLRLYAIERERDRMP